MSRFLEMFRLLWGLGLSPFNNTSVQFHVYVQIQLKTITIIWFKLCIFLEDVQIIHGISLYFFKTIYFLKYVMVSHYIYIYIYNLEFNFFQTLRFLYLIIHLPQKLKIQIDMQQKIGLQLKSNLESNWILTLQFLQSTIHSAQN